MRTFTAPACCVPQSRIMRLPLSYEPSIRINLPFCLNLQEEWRYLLSSLYVPSWGWQSLQRSSSAMNQPSLRWFLKTFLSKSVTQLLSPHPLSKALGGVQFSSQTSMILSPLLATRRSLSSNICPVWNVFSWEANKS